MFSFFLTIFFEMWGFRELRVLEVRPLLILNNLVWLLFLPSIEAEWSSPVLLHSADLPRVAERFEIHAGESLHMSWNSVPFGDGAMCAHSQASWDVIKASPTIPGVVKPRNGVSPQFRRRLGNPAARLPELREAFRAPASRRPVTPSQVFSALVASLGFL